MTPCADAIAAGSALFAFDQIDSTNDEAFRLLRNGTPVPFWVIAREQTRGRGRGSRPWVSPPGNLYATCAFRPFCSTAAAAQLSFVAGLAAHDALAAALPEGMRPALRIKWPNDVMLGDAKLGGILLESAQLPQEAQIAVLIGFGLNLAIAPDIGGRATASAAGGEPLSPKTLQRDLAATLEARLALWDRGLGFDAIRAAWTSRAYRLGQEISVAVHGGEVGGRFEGVDDGGALKILTPGGEIRHVLSGEVVLPALTHRTF
jgi:BirA family biotin operon repressor/biotin-[acetyl-CoA-carboxylase] ligase